MRILCFVLAVIAFKGFESSVECPKQPEQVAKDVQGEVSADVAKISRVSGIELKGKAQAVTVDLLGKLPKADSVYLEQMFFASYCSAIRDDKSLAESEKAKRLLEYRRNVRPAVNQTIQQQSSKPSRRGAQATSGTTIINGNNNIVGAGNQVSPLASTPQESQYARLEFTLYSDRGEFLPMLEQTLTPDVTGAVTVKFFAKNSGNVPARNGELWVRIPRQYEYAGETGVYSTPGPATDRYMRFPELSPGVYLQPMTVTVKPPAGTQQFIMGFMYACETCAPKHDWQKITIHLSQKASE